jgi:aspartyl-tRNA(Asn)/glutamyl-tRNA(Gln) amidotransferase subunit C
MSISRKEVEHIALLSRLSPSESELEGMTHHLQDILGYMEKLNELDTSNVEATSHPIPMSNVFAEDKIQQSVDNQTALNNTADSEGPFFKVPSIID